MYCYAWKDWGVENDEENVEEAHLREEFLSKTTSSYLQGDWEDKTAEKTSSLVEKIRVSSEEVSILQRKRYQTSGPLGAGWSKRVQMLDVCTNE